MFQASGTRFGSRGNCSGLHPKHTQIACSVVQNGTRQYIERSTGDWSCHVTNFHRGSMELKSTMEGFGSSTDQHTDQHRNFRPAVRTVGPKAQ